MNGIMPHISLMHDTWQTQSYTVSQKTMPPNSCPYLCQIVTYFQNCLLAYSTGHLQQSDC